MITYFVWAALIIEKVYTDECEAKADSMFVLAPASWVCPQRTSLHGRPAPSLFHPFSVWLMDTHTNKSQTPDPMKSSWNLFAVIHCPPSLIAWHFASHFLTSQKFAGLSQLASFMWFNTYFWNYATANVTPGNAMEFIVLDESSRIMGFSMIQHFNELQSHPSNEVDWTNYIVSTKYYWKVTQVYQSHISNQVAVPVPFSNLFQLMQSWKRKPTLGSCTRSPECRKYSDVLLSWSKQKQIDAED